MFCVCVCVFLTQFKRRKLVIHISHQDTIHFHSCLIQMKFYFLISDFSCVFVCVRIYLFIYKYLFTYLLTDLFIHLLILLLGETAACLRIEKKMSYFLSIPLNIFETILSHFFPLPSSHKASVRCSPPYQQKSVGWRRSQFPFHTRTEVISRGWDLRRDL